MKQKLITTHEAKTHLSKYLTLVSEGAEILIGRGKEPMAKLVGLSKKEIKKRPKVGTITSEGISYTIDCFAALDSNELASWGI